MKNTISGIYRLNSEKHRRNIQIEVSHLEVGAKHVKDSDVNDVVLTMEVFSFLHVPMP